MDEQQENRESEHGRLKINDIIFLQISRGDDYILYRATERCKLGEIIVDLFLEHVPDKGWWGAMRLNGFFRIQLRLDHHTLFPTPEIALQATEEFLADEQRVREALADMREQELTLRTLHYTPPRPTDVDPEKYFSPVSLEVNGTFFILYSLTKTDATYRSWAQRQAAGVTFDLRLSHVYWKGWQAALRFADESVVIFEPAVDQLFLTPEMGLARLLAFCSEEESMHNLVQRLRELNDSRDHIMVTSKSVPSVAKPPLHVNHGDFVWQKQISEGDLYQAKRANFIRSRFFRFQKVDVQLVQTWRRGWLGALQIKGISPLYFEKERNIEFSSPEEALAITRFFLSQKREGLQILLLIHAEKIALQCKTGQYGQMFSARITTEE